eukprot:TRINITY_DN6589_c0_g1_i15.p1 TRINITY_DN6589_c0_g1~~TRINITY_DN6589_c0_g1_i15.p1  ORF type:complete len:102 (-),score=29.47 TRINITY_DN6589_c0_g1_i15:60-365(-)
MKPLFTGKNEKDQLKKIFKLMGSPTEEKWPELKNLSEWNPEEFEPQEAESLKTLVPRLDDDGVDLLGKMLRCNPAERITAKNALSHPYFNDVPESLKRIYS